MTSLSAAARTISYVFMLCGIFVCYHVITSQHDSKQQTETQYNTVPNGQMQVNKVPLLSGNIGPQQDNLVQQARDTVTQIQQRKDTNKVQDESPEGSVDTRHPEPEDPKERSNSLRKLNEFWCGRQSPPAWCQIEPPEDIMQIKLPDFIKNYKNPCWWVDQSKEGPPPIRCLPYFYLIGAPKSGTTDLYWRLIQHPQMSSLVKKEIHWLTRERYTSLASKRQTKSQMFVTYTDVFKAVDTDLFNSVDDNDYHYKIFADASVSTFWDNMGSIRQSIRSGTQMPKTPECIHHLNPKTKFVSIIRDPVERTYSDYMYFDIYPDKSKEAFHNAVTAAIKYSGECLKQYSFEDCIDYADKISNQPMARLSIGIYYHHFKGFFKYFPRDQFIIMKMEDYSDQLPENLAKVFSFLDLDPLLEERMAIVANKSYIYNARPSSSVKVGDMLPETRTLLKDFYRPFNDELGKLLGEYYSYNKKT